MLSARASSYHVTIGISFYLNVVIYFLLVNACVSGPQIFSIYVRPSIISDGANMYIYIYIYIFIYIYIYTYINVQSSFQVYILYDLLLRNLVKYIIYIIIH